MKLLNSFKKKEDKDPDKQCGYLDFNNHFYTDKRQRDEQNLRIEKQNAEDLFNDHVCREKSKYFGALEEYQHCNLIDELISKGTIANLVDAYIKYRAQLNNIDKKYGQS
jgi:hypothetical protein